MQVPDTMLAAVTRAIGPTGVSLDAPDPAIKILTRRLKDADVVFIFNEGSQTATHAITLRTNATHGETWDAASGTVSPIVGKSAHGAMTVQLTLQPYATQLFVLR